MKKLALIALFSLVSLSLGAWEIVGPSDPIRPAGTVIRKLVGSSTFVYDGAPESSVEFNVGTVDVATPTVGLDAITPKDVSDYLPAGCQGFEFRVTFGDVVLTNGGMIATGSFQQRIGRLIASGSTFIWRDIGGPFVGKFMANSDTASVTFDLAW